MKFSENQKAPDPVMFLNTNWKNPGFSSNRKHLNFKDLSWENLWERKWKGSSISSISENIQNSTMSSWKVESPLKKESKLKVLKSQSLF